MAIYLSIKDMIGRRCFLNADGQKIYDEIVGPLKNGEVVVLDFDEITQVGVSFLNLAIGQLLKHITVDQLYSLLKIVNLKQMFKIFVDRVIDNATKMRGKSPEMIIDDILNAEANGS